jgi:hypothetical protein
MLMADGSVRYIAKDIDPAVLKSMGEAPPIATREQIAVPPRPTHFRSSGNPRRPPPRYEK